MLKDHFYLVEPDAEGLVAYWKFDEGAGTASSLIIAEMRTMLLQWNRLTWTAVELPAK